MKTVGTSGLANVLNIVGDHITRIRRVAGDHITHIHTIDHAQLASIDERLKIVHDREMGTLLSSM